MVSFDTTLKPGDPAPHGGTRLAVRARGSAFQHPFQAPAHPAPKETAGSRRSAHLAGRPAGFKPLRPGGSDRCASRFRPPRAERYFTTVLVPYYPIRLVSRLLTVAPWRQPAPAGPSAWLCQPHPRERTPQGSGQRDAPPAPPGSTRSAAGSPSAHHPSPGSSLEGAPPSTVRLPADGEPTRQTPARPGSPARAKAGGVPGAAPPPGPWHGSPPGSRAARCRRRARPPGASHRSSGPAATAPAPHPPPAQSPSASRGPTRRGAKRPLAARRRSPRHHGRSPPPAPGRVPPPAGPCARASPP